MKRLQQSFHLYVSNYTQRNVGIFLNVNYVKWPSESGVKDDEKKLNEVLPLQQYFHLFLIVCHQLPYWKCFGISLNVNYVKWSLGVRG